VATTEVKSTGDMTDAWARHQARQSVARQLNVPLTTLHTEIIEQGTIYE
jgi:hypothetical protein